MKAAHPSPVNGHNQTKTVSVSRTHARIRHLYRGVHSRAMKAEWEAPVKVYIHTDTVHTRDSHTSRNNLFFQCLSLEQSTKAKHINKQSNRTSLI